MFLSNFDFRICFGFRFGFEFCPSTFCIPPGTIVISHGKCLNPIQHPIQFIKTECHLENPVWQPSTIPPRLLLIRQLSKSNQPTALGSTLHDDIFRSFEPATQCATRFSMKFVARLASRHISRDRLPSKFLRQTNAAQIQRAKFRFSRNCMSLLERVGLMISATPAAATDDLTRPAGRFRSRNFAINLRLSGASCFFGADHRADVAIILDNAP